MVSRPAKLAKLDDFRRSVPFVSQSGMSAVLKQIKDHGMPDLHSRKDMRAATRNVVHEDTPYGKLLCTLTLRRSSGTSELPVTCVNPLALIWKMMQQGGPFANFMTSRIAKSPNMFEMRAARRIARHTISGMFVCK